MTPEQALKQYFGYDRFRPYQEQVVRAILSRRDVLAVMPTGAGKSVCYQLPAVMLEGVTLVISPLISLMQDQVQALIQSGIRAAWLNSTLTPRQQQLALERAGQGAYQIIYVAPERLNLPAFRRFAQQAPISLVTVDEAHCISQWGHDFRPSYLEIADFLASLPHRPPVAAFTATATQSVREDIIRSLGLQEPLCFVSGFDRPNLYFEVRESSHRDQDVLETLARFPDRSGIIYCLSRKKVEELCQLLCDNGYPATRYHAGLDPQERRQNQEDFLYDRRTVMVATNAFGMGIDKSNVGFVIHCGMPGNPESYYQEAGRAGRDGSPAQCILLFQRRDIATNRYFIEHGEERSDLTPEQSRQLRQHDLQRLQKMVHYCTTPGCLRHTLLSYFGEQSPERCGNCSNCLGGQAPEDATAEGRQFVFCVALLSREGRAFGSAAIIKILLGTEDPAIDWLRPQRLECWGALAGSSPAKLRRVAAALEDQGFLRRTEGERPVLELTPLAPSLVSGKAHLIIKAQTTKKERRQAQARASGSSDSPLFPVLREVRARLAKAESVPAFIIFNDATLRELCRVQPRNRTEFLQVKGVGEKKAEKYAAPFLEVIRTYQTDATKE
ncbi:MAG: DNA helicase RecQ [Clostridiales bacterium]|nr:DNA helicase RecQ [Clostridiales bacterium]